mmetsp:Transcript_21429/g.73871  ORF Transcript_21429/g.73871 Transcript_21429/m.73871 type:complete len:207 (-) Transcript_21429:905-1525(-)
MVHDGAVRRPLEVRERGEVRREERQRFCFRGEVFTNRRGDGSPVAGRSPAANLVDADERPRRRAADQLGGLAHLALECGLAGARVVAGADARHNAIKDGEPRACVRGHKRPDVRQHRRHRRRAHERRLAAHVRPRDEPAAVAPHGVRGSAVRRRAEVDVRSNVRTSVVHQRPFHDGVPQVAECQDGTVVGREDGGARPFKFHGCRC